MTRIAIERLEATAKAAKAAGLLTAREADRFVTDEIERRQDAAYRLPSSIDDAAAAGMQQISKEEMEAAVKAWRAERERINMEMAMMVGVIAGLM